MTEKTEKNERRVLGSYLQNLNIALQAGVFKKGDY